MSDSPEQVVVVHSTVPSVPLWHHLRIQRDPFGTPCSSFVTDMLLEARSQLCEGRRDRCLFVNLCPQLPSLPVSCLRLYSTAALAIWWKLKRRSFGCCVRKKEVG